MIDFLYEFSSVLIIFGIPLMNICICAMCFVEIEKIEVKLGIKEKVK